MRKFLSLLLVLALSVAGYQHALTAHKPQTWAPQQTCCCCCCQQQDDNPLTTTCITSHTFSSNTQTDCCQTDADRCSPHKKCCDMCKCHIVLTGNPPLAAISAKGTILPGAHFAVLFVLREIGLPPIRSTAPDSPPPKSA